jgi:hypothetical protein
MTWQFSIPPRRDFTLPEVVDEGGVEYDDVDGDAVDRDDDSISTPIQAATRFDANYISLRFGIWA